MNRTKIEWVKNPDGSQGYTWNPITGCLNHDNGLCKGGGFPCYAYKLANGRLKPLYLANHCLATGAVEPSKLQSFYQKEADPFYPRFWEERLFEPVNKIRRWGRQSRVVHRQSPKGIFVCDMSDLFGIGIPDVWTSRVLDRFKYCPQHRFYLLTKQPQNLIKFSPFPENCWVGVTATNFHMFGLALLYLSTIEAKVKYVSFEPLLDRILSEGIGGYGTDFLEADLAHHINWLIIGAQTNPYKPPKIEWVREIVEAADKAGIPVFLKDNLLELVNYVSPETDFAFSKEGDYRQQMPRLAEDDLKMELV